jgi:hypothetical protein
MNIHHIEHWLWSKIIGTILNLVKSRIWKVITKRVSDYFGGWMFAFFRYDEMLDALWYSTLTLAVLTAAGAAFFIYRRSSRFQIPTAC